MPAEYEKDPNFLLTVHGYVMGMRRVKGDDGDKDVAAAPISKAPGGVV